MKQRRKKAESRERTFQVWTHQQAESALPYFTSIMQSLREHYITALGHRLQGKRLRERAGRADRATLVAVQDTDRAAEKAEGQFNDALKELWQLNVYCLDPVQGLALIPFAHEDQLGWFVFDLFDSNKVSSWRYHSDSLETRRPLDELLKEPPPTSVVV